VHFVADNAGSELAVDLALVDCVLEDAAARVTLHLKMQPVFVSDATPRDVHDTIHRMTLRGGTALGLSERLRVAFDTGRLVLAPDPFWSGPHFLWEAPEHIGRALSGATITIFKGDANYRRVVGDALWPADTPFTHAASFAAYPLLCLRTMKSDSVVGLPVGLARTLDQTDPRWRIDGRRGLIQVHLA
jgi:hypothetical protein